MLNRVSQKSQRDQGSRLVSRSERTFVSEAGVAALARLEVLDEHLDRVLPRLVRVQFAVVPVRDLRCAGFEGVQVCGMTGRKYYKRPWGENCKKRLASTSSLELRKSAPEMGCSTRGGETERNMKDETRALSLGVERCNAHSASVRSDLTPMAPS